MSGCGQAVEPEDGGGQSESGNGTEIFKRKTGEESHMLEA